MVENGDFVYLLGDYCFGPYDVQKRILDRLNGRKILVMGNHDRLPPNRYIEMGFCGATRKPIMIEPGVILMHEPFIEADKYVLEPYIYFFGHVHDKHTEMENYKNCRCVSAERIQYKPLDLVLAIKDIKRKIKS